MNSISIKIQKAKTTRNTGETNHNSDQTVTESLNLVKNVKTERNFESHN